MSLIDDKVLANFTDNSKVIEKEILGILIKDIPKGLENLNVAMQEKDDNTIKIICHSLINYSRYVGNKEIEGLIKIAEPKILSEFQSCEESEQFARIFQDIVKEMQNRILS